MGATRGPDFAELVASYWDHYRLSTSEVRAERLAAESTWAAVVDVEEIARDDDLAVPLMVALAEAAPGPKALAFLGAGPIENLLRGRPAEAVLDRIDEAARRNEKFRTAVRCVWWGEDDDAGLIARFQRFGPPW